MPFSERVRRLLDRGPVRRIIDFIARHAEDGSRLAARRPEAIRRAGQRASASAARSGPVEGRVSLEDFPTVGTTSALAQNDGNLRPISVGQFNSGSAIVLPIQIKNGQVQLNYETGVVGLVQIREDIRWQMSVDNTTGEPYNGGNKIDMTSPDSNEVIRLTRVVDPAINNRDDFDTVIPPSRVDMERLLTKIFDQLMFTREERVSALGGKAVEAGRLTASATVPRRAERRKYDRSPYTYLPDTAVVLPDGNEVEAGVNYISGEVFVRIQDHEVLVVGRVPSQSNRIEGSEGRDYSQVQALIIQDARNALGATSFADPRDGKSRWVVDYGEMIGRLAEINPNLAPLYDETPKLETASINSNSRNTLD